MLAFLAKLSAHPIVQGILLPAMKNALVEIYEKWATETEKKAAITLAKNAKTAEELRLASKVLGTSNARR